MVFTPKGIYPANFVSDNELAREDLNGGHIATPSICLYKMLVNMKHGSFVAEDRSLDFFSSDEQRRCFNKVHWFKFQWLIQERCY